MTNFGNYLLTPTTNQQYFYAYHQHAPMLLPNGNILVYDNGLFRASPPDAVMPDATNFSRAVEYAIDEQSMQVQQVWEYGQFANPSYYSGAMGDADYLPQTGNVLIVHGNLADVTNSGKLSARIIEVTHTSPGIEVFNLVINDESLLPGNGWRIYRSERLPNLYP